MIRFWGLCGQSPLHVFPSYLKNDDESSGESTSSQGKGSSSEEEDNAKGDKGKTKASSDEQEVSESEDKQEHPHTQDTLTGVSQLFSEHKDTDPKSDSEEKVQTTWKRQHKDSLKEDSPKKDSSESSSSEEEPPTNEVLCDKARQKVKQLDMCFHAWHRDKFANKATGWAMQDTMNCDLPEHSKTQPNHPNPMGPPLGYMAKCKVFDCIQSDLYDLCCFYALGMTGDPPDFPPPWKPGTCNQVKELLKSARLIGHPCMILVHSNNCMTTMSMLQELHTTTCLRCLQVDLHDKSIKRSFCPFCAYAGANNLSYLNHIIIVHYNASYGCGKHLKQAFVSSSTLHNQKNVCLRFDKVLAASPAAAVEVTTAKAVAP